MVASSDLSHQRRLRNVCVTLTSRAFRQAQRGTSANGEYPIIKSLSQRRNSLKEGFSAVAEALEVTAYVRLTKLCLLRNYSCLTDGCLAFSLASFLANFFALFSALFSSCILCASILEARSKVT